MTSLNLNLSTLNGSSYKFFSVLFIYIGLSQNFLKEDILSMNEKEKAIMRQNTSLTKNVLHDPMHGRRISGSTSIDSTEEPFAKKLELHQRPEFSRIPLAKTGDYLCILLEVSITDSLDKKALYRSYINYLDLKKNKRVFECSRLRMWDKMPIGVLYA